MKLIQKVVKLVAGILGVLEIAIPVIKESLVLLSRVCGVIFFWTDIDEVFIEKLNEAYEIIIDYYEDFKNIWLVIGGNDV